MAFLVKPWAVYLSCLSLGHFLIQRWDGGLTLNQQGVSDLVIKVEDSIGSAWYIIDFTVVLHQTT